MIKFNNRSVFYDKKVNRKKAQSKEAAQVMLDQDVLKDSNFFIPADEFNLRDSSLIHTKIGSGQIIWNTKYARRLYWNPQYNFSKDKNPHAAGKWFELAKAKKRPDWIDNIGDEYARYFDGR